MKPNPSSKNQRKKAAKLNRRKLKKEQTLSPEEIYKAALKYNRTESKKIPIARTHCLNKVVSLIKEQTKSDKATLTQGHTKKMPDFKNLLTIIVYKYTDNCAFKGNLISAGGKILILPLSTRPAKSTMML